VDLGRLAGAQRSRSPRRCTTTPASHVPITQISRPTSACSRLRRSGPSEWFSCWPSSARGAWPRSAIVPHYRSSDRAELQPRPVTTLVDKQPIGDPLAELVDVTDQSDDSAAGPEIIEHGHHLLQRA